MIIHFLLIFLTLVLLHIWIRYSRTGRLIDKIPGPKAFPIIGNLLSFTIPPKKIWIVMHEWQKQYPIYRLWGGAVPIVFTRHPDHLKTLLSGKKNLNKNIAAYNSMRSCGNDGLVISHDELWKCRRKIIDPAFSFNMLEFYSKKIESYGKKFSADLMSADEKSIVHDVSSIYMQLMFDMAVDAIMDYQSNTENQSKRQVFREAIGVIGQTCYYRIYHRYIQDWMMKFIPLGRRHSKAWKVVNKFAEEVLENRQKNAENRKVLKHYLDNIENLNADEIKATKKNLSVIDILLQSMDKGLMDSKGAVDETVIMIGASYETSAASLTFLTLSLAEHKEVQDLARQELLDVVGGYNKEITMNHIKKLDYLERCVKESLRLYSVLPYIGRSIDEEIKLGDYTIPVGTEVYINIFRLHRDPEHWPDPLKFDPDRFLLENVKKRHPFAYSPFSRGPRNCIGYKFAMLAMKTVIAHVLYKYYLEPVDFSADFEFDLGLTLQVDQSRVKFIKIH